MKLFKRNDLKSYLLFSSKSFLRILRLSPKQHFLPSLIIYPSNICNFKCMMCDEGADNIKTAQRMDFNTLEKIIKECSTYTIKPKIHFSGLGEPLLYSEIINLMQLCKRYKVNWSMTTNGFLLEKYAENIVENSCQAINISIHGNEAEHNEVTGIDNAFRKVICGLQKLDIAKRNNKVSLPLIAINCVITNKNVLSLKTVLDRLITLPVNSITFQHLKFSIEDFQKKMPFVLHEKETIESLKQFIAYVNCHNFPIKINFFPKIKIDDIHDYYSVENNKFNFSCILPWLSARIHPDGSIEMCENVYGNIREASLKSIINNDKAILFRSKLIKNKFKSRVCFRCCHRHYY